MKALLLFTLIVFSTLQQGERDSNIIVSPPLFPDKHTTASDCGTFGHPHLDHLHEPRLCAALLLLSRRWSENDRPDTLISHPFDSR
jgi:hypothetical protein